MKTLPLCIATAAGSALLASACSASPPANVPAPRSADPAGVTAAAGSHADPVASLIVTQTNQFRAAHHLPPVTPAPELMKAAQDFAAFMAQTDRYGHEADGRSPGVRAQQHGYRWCMVAENIAYQYSSEGFRVDDLANRFVVNWENSPGHRRNMLEPQATDTGVGVVQSPTSSTYYAVQVFGRLQGQCRRERAAALTRSPER